ncbi:MAG: hypothetical protein HFE83_03185 [Lachnospiraceae bacterium]|nr:hypothetical protein [Lachnospiraceae bacterium]
MAGLMAERNGALENITALDLGRVIKVEQPGKGDDSRQYGPYVNGESSYYANMNRNKGRHHLKHEGHEGKGDPEGVSQKGGRPD